MRCMPTINYNNKENEMSEKRTNWVTAVLFMLTVWCMWNSVNTYNWAGDAIKLADKANNNVGIIKLTVEEMHSEVRGVKNDINKIESKIKEFDLDVLPFGEAFNKMHDMYGEGSVFDWRDNLYTTNLKGEQPWQQQ